MHPARPWRRFAVITPLAALVLAAQPAAPSAAQTADPPARALVTRSATCPSPARARSSDAQSTDARSTRTAPTVVLVHGAWADTSSWNGEVRQLQRAGYVARAIADPLRNLTSDAASVADFLKTVSGPIVLVGHSYGGSVITNAAAGNPDVKALVYVDAAAPDVGETTAQLSGAGSVLNGNSGSLYDKVPYPLAPQGATDLYLKQDVFVRSFASDLPRGVALRLWATQRPASTSAFTTPSKAAAWKTIPSWYFISTGDRIITPASKLAMAHRAHAKVTRYHGGSHLTLTSNPEAVTAVIMSAVCSVR